MAAGIMLRLDEVEGEWGGYVVMFPKDIQRNMGMLLGVNNLYHEAPAQRTALHGPASWRAPEEQKFVGGRAGLIEFSGGIYHHIGERC